MEAGQKNYLFMSQDDQVFNNLLFKHCELNFGLQLSFEAGKTIHAAPHAKVLLTIQSMRRSAMRCLTYQNKRRGNHRSLPIQ
jgi:hypothetical protein